MIFLQNRFGTAFYLILLGAVTLLSQPLAARQPVFVEASDLKELALPYEPVYSPDGNRMAYTVAGRDAETGSENYRVWMTTTDGSSPVAVTSDQYDSWNPVFSSDGKRIFFLSSRDEEGITQLWDLALDSAGEARQLTELQRSIDRIRLSPDESTLLLVLTDEPEPKVFFQGATVAVVERIQIKADYVGYLTGQRDHIYTLALSNGELKRITDGDFDHSEPAWSPDGKKIVFVSNRSADADLNYNTDLWLVDAKGGKPVRLTNSPLADSGPVWHPDGKEIAYLATKPGIPQNHALLTLARIEIETGHVRLPGSALDRNAYQPQFNSDGSALYFRIEDSAEVHLGRLDWTSNSIDRPLAKRASISDYTVHGSGNVAVVMSDDTTPAEIYQVSPGHDPLRLTTHNKAWRSGKQIGSTESFTTETEDGLIIEALATFPPGYDSSRSYPAILSLHGGPLAQHEHLFDLETQLLAASGYLVIRPNPRGSSGYGQAFALGIYQGWGESDYGDILAVADEAVQRGWADADRLGVGGYSYGGILTNYILGQTNLFKAAVSGAGSGLYTASYGHDEYHLWYEQELGLPWENREPWERLSPFNHIHKATTPTLFMGGSLDWNVPIQGSEQLYQVMKRQGIDTQLVVYEGEHHGGWSYANKIDSMLRTVDWYNRYLKKK